MAFDNPLFTSPVLPTPTAPRQTVGPQTASIFFAEDPRGGGVPFGGVAPAPLPTSPAPTAAPAPWYPARIFAPTTVAQEPGVPFGYEHTVDAKPELVPPPLHMGDGSPMFATPEYHELNPVEDPAPPPNQPSGLSTEIVTDDNWLIGSGQAPPNDHRPVDVVPFARTAAVLAALAAAGMLAVAFLGNRPKRRSSTRPSASKRKPARKARR